MKLENIRLLLGIFIFFGLYVNHHHPLFLLTFQIYISFKKLVNLKFSRNKSKYPFKYKIGHDFIDNFIVQLFQFSQQTMLSNFIVQLFQLSQQTRSFNFIVQFFQLSPLSMSSNSIVQFFQLSQQTI